MLLTLAANLAVLQPPWSYLQVPKLEASEDYVHPAWFAYYFADGTKLKVIVPQSMAVSAFASPDHKWFLVSSYKYFPPGDPKEGYSAPAYIAKRGAEQLILYRFSGKKTSLIRTYLDEANWTPLAWDQNNTKVLLHAFPSMGIMEKNNNDRLYLLDLKTKQLKQIFGSFKIDWATFVDNDQAIELKKEDRPDQSRLGYIHRVRVKIDLAGHVLNKFLPL